VRSKKHRDHFKTNAVFKIRVTSEELQDKYGEHLKSRRSEKQIIQNFEVGGHLGANRKSQGTSFSRNFFRSFDSVSSVDLVSKEVFDRKLSLLPRSDEREAN
jgi:hypothetical protein